MSFYIPFLECIVLLKITLFTEIYQIYYGFKNVQTTHLAWHWFVYEEGLERAIPLLVLPADLRDELVTRGRAQVQEPGQ